MDRLRQHFEGWQQAYIEGDLDSGPPPLVGDSSDEDERRARRYLLDVSSDSENDGPPDMTPQHLRLLLDQHFSTVGRRVGPGRR